MSQMALIVTNPATEETIAEIEPNGGGNDAVVARAAAAFRAWRAVAPTGRARLLRRLAQPREIVNAALYLASDESSHVNAATFVVDGGITGAYVTPE